MKEFPSGGREFLFREGSFSVLRFEATIAITPVEFGTSLKKNAIPTNES